MPYDPSLYDDNTPDRDYVTPPFSSWPDARHGPEPIPEWVITDPNAFDTDLGVLKTGKEADVHLVSRALGGTESLLAAKRYRTAEHRMFHRDAGYQEGRRTRRSRDQRAVARGTGFGREVAATTWANAEFAALSELWGAGVPVPYPVHYWAPNCCSSSSAATTAPRHLDLRSAALTASSWPTCLRSALTR